MSAFHRVFQAMQSKQSRKSEMFSELLQTAREQHRNGFDLHDSVQLAAEHIAPYRGEFWNGGNRSHH